MGGAVAVPGGDTARQEALKLKTFHLLYCCPIDVDRGVLPLLFPEVHDHLLSFVDVELTLLLYSVVLPDCI